MHLIDSLAAGGAERVAVNLANNLPQERYRVHLCATRRGGSLSSLLQPHVELLVLNRRARFDLAAIMRLVPYIRARNIKLLHAHSSSLFLAVAASLLPPYPRVVWHDHYGGANLSSRPALLYRLAVKRAAAVIAVSKQLADWSRHDLRVPSKRVYQISSFVENVVPGGELPILPGEPGTRIVCVANLRPQKDHPTLLKAMVLVKEHLPGVHLLLVGATVDSAYLSEVSEEITKLALTSNVSLLGHRSDVYAVLKACDVAVLSSASEAFPLALLEYGMVGMATVATRVGECAEVLDKGAAGLLVPSGSPQELAGALLSLLRSSQQRNTFGERLRKRIHEQYSLQSSLRQVCQIYDLVMKLDQPQASDHALIHI